MNNGGGNYGPRLVYPDGRLQLFSIIGCWTQDEAGNPTYPPNNGYLSTILHEYNHSFVNPAVNDHWTDFRDVDNVYAVVADQMRGMAYGDAKTMVYESLVRAAVIVYFEQSGQGLDSNQKIRQEQRQGFFWMDRLVEKLKQYDAQRVRYPTFSSYVPQIALYYRKLAADARAEAEAFAEKSAHVVRMEPFMNQAQAVDASTSTITIMLDKPLDPNAGYSINKGMEGDEHYPIAGKPTFASDGLRLLLPVQLRPNQRYSFVLSSLAFATRDGYPLQTFRIEFKTK